MSNGEAPPPLPWREYRTIIENEWEDLLNSEGPEADFQAFFERHPCMLPRPYSLFAGGHHGPYPSALITQPELPGYRRRRPDFMWLAQDSLMTWAVLIEIERPDKRWFTQAGEQTADLTQAKGQLAEWRAWFAEPENVLQFRRLHQLPDESRWRGTTFGQKYVLIYGRREEATREAQLNLKRAQLEGIDEALMTYDRLGPDRELSNFMTVTVNERGYHAREVSAVMELTWLAVADWIVVSDKHEAIRRNPYMSDARKEYLIAQLPEWEAEWERRTREGGRFNLGERT